MKRKNQSIQFDATQDNLGSQLGLTTERANELRNEEMNMVKGTEAKNPLYLIGGASALAKTEEELAFILLNLGFWRADMNAKKEIRTLRQCNNDQSVQLGQCNAKINELEGIIEGMVNDAVDDLHDTILKTLRDQSRELVLHLQYERDIEHGITSPGIDRRHIQQFGRLTREMPQPPKPPYEKMGEMAKLDFNLNKNLAPYREYIKEIHIDMDNKTINVVRTDGANRNAHVTMGINKGIELSLMAVYE